MSDDAFLPYVYNGGASSSSIGANIQTSWLSLALTGGSHDGEDLVQDTMVKAFVKWDRVQRYQRPGAWCLRVLTHACRDHWRRGRTQGSFPGPPASRRTVVAGTGSRVRRLLARRAWST